MIQTAATPSRVEPAPTGISVAHDISVLHRRLRDQNPPTKGPPSHLNPKTFSTTPTTTNPLWERALPARGPPSHPNPRTSTTPTTINPLWERALPAMAPNLPTQKSPALAHPVHYTRTHHLHRPIMATPDTRICPACGSRNDCTLAEPKTTTQNCWCYSVTIDPAVLAALPDYLRNAACLCPRCAQADPSLRTNVHTVQP